MLLLCNAMFVYKGLNDSIHTYQCCFTGIRQSRDCPSASEHYHDVIMSAMASQITSFTIVYSTVFSGADQRKHQSSASQAFVQGIHRWPVNSQHKWPVTRKMFPFDDVIMSNPKDMIKIVWYMTITKYDKSWTVCIYLWMYCKLCEYNTVRVTDIKS